MVVPVLLLTIGAVVLVFGSRRHWPAAVRRSAPPPSTHRAAAVVAQHIQYRQGGMLSPGAVEEAKRLLEPHLEYGDFAAIERLLQPGVRFLEQVRALVELSTKDAGQVLERMLRRRLSEDAVEQSWYLLDLVQGLRELNHSESLPAILHTLETSGDSPLVHLFAAETVLFRQFADCLALVPAPQGQSALRVLRLTLEGIRLGYLPDSLYLDAQLGDLVLRLADACPDVADSRLTLVFIEAMRHRRLAHLGVSDKWNQSSLVSEKRRQTACLRDAEPVLREYLHDIGPELVRQLSHTPYREHPSLLAAISELRVECCDQLLDCFVLPDYPYPAQAIRCLQWSKDPRAGMMLRGLARKLGSSRRSVGGLWGATTTSQSQLLTAVLEALRGHPGDETEAILLGCCRTDDLAMRIAAIQSLGWWEPVDRDGVMEVVSAAYVDSRPELMRAALAVFARLGECRVLQNLREGLNELSPTVHEIIDLIANEGLTWLWPDLDVLTESDDSLIAGHAWEAIERLRESVLGPLG